MSTPSIAFIITGSGAVAGSVNGKPFSFQSDFPKYAEVKTALANKDVNALLALVDTAATINKYGRGKCTVEAGVVMFDGKPLANVMIDRILKQMQAGFPVDSMLHFLENLMSNPSQVAIDELYLFLEATEIPITEDGYFLAYKRVRDDYKDIYAGKFDNSIGAKPEMKREDVNPDRQQTCSRGLHFCSRSYLPNYGADSNGNRTMIVKVNPADVVSIPSDYANAKGRAWRYEVVGEHTEGDDKPAFNQPVVSSNDGEYGLKPSNQKFWNVRNNKGQFTKR